MNAKEYLSQARYIDMRIESKIQQIDALNDLAKKCTSVLSGMPGSSTSNTSRMADTVGKIVDLQADIAKDTETLIDLKKEIIILIQSVENRDYRTLLEQRYLAFRTWEDISNKMHYGITWVKKMHERALNVVDRLLEKSVTESDL